MVTEENGSGKEKSHVVSLEVPTSYRDLVQAMLGFPAFGICFTLLVLIWYQHHLFFRSYPLADVTTIVLNAILVFVVLFYVYPLKFLFSFLVAALFHLPVDAPTVENALEARNLMVVYGIGFVAVFGDFLFLHLHALRRKAELGLDAEETYEAMTRAQHYGVYVLVGAISITIAVASGGRGAMWSGLSYALLGPLAAIHGRWRRRGRKRLRTRAA